MFPCLKHCLNITLYLQLKYSIVSCICKFCIKILFHEISCTLYLLVTFYKVYYPSLPTSQQAALQCFPLFQRKKTKSRERGTGTHQQPIFLSKNAVSNLISVVTHSYIERTTSLVSGWWCKGRKKVVKIPRCHE